MLIVPSYIDMPSLLDAPVKYRWNDDDLDSFYSESDRIENLIAKTTTCGAVALALGCLEWVAWRLSERCNVTLLLQAVEAVWAGIIDPRYVRSLDESPLALGQSDWLGPERGPVYAAYWQLVDLLETLHDKEPASPEASCAVRLGRHVMPDTKRFDAWWQGTAKRLAELYPEIDEEDEVGDPIPREALDPNVEYRTQNAKRFLKAFLAGLDPKENPFLASSAEMKKAGFKKVPYVL